MPSRPSRRQARRRRCVRASGCPGRRSIDVGAPRHAPTPTRPRAPSPRALGTTERQAVLDVLHSERFVDQSPAEVHATLLGEQTYLCSRARCIACSRRPTKCASGAPRPGIRCTRNPSSWRRARIRSGPGTSPSSRADPVSLLLALCDPRPLQPLRRGWMVALHEDAHLAERLIEQTLCQAGHRSAPTHDSCGPRGPHAEQTRRAALLGSG